MTGGGITRRRAQAFLRIIEMFRFLFRKKLIDPKEATDLDLLSLYVEEMEDCGVGVVDHKQ
jgi:hypothetical protein